MEIFERTPITTPNFFKNADALPLPRLSVGWICPELFDIEHPADRRNGTVGPISGLSELYNPAQLQALTFPQGGRADRSKCSY
jgi:hypothetical protein